MAEGKLIYTGNARVIEGVVKTANAIKTTLGPAGKAVAISSDIGPEVSRDGATVAKSISFKDDAMNLGAQLVKQAASLSESLSGDGTSTSSILIKELVVKGQKAVETGSNVNEIKAGMLKAGRWMGEYIKAHSTPIAGDLEKIRKVATISANNDPEIGDLIVDGLKEVGVNGILTAELSSGLDTTIKVTTGMKLSRGWASPNYATEDDGKCIMENPYVIVIGEKISSVNQLIPVLETISKTAEPFLLVCDDIDESVNTMLVFNVMRGAVRCCVVKGIDYGDARKNVMADIAIATGAKYYCQETGLSVGDQGINHLENFGRAKKVVVSRDDTVIFEGQGEPDAINNRIEVLKKRLEDKGISNYDRSKFESRLANLAGGIGIISVGGASEVEAKNKKQTVEDAILASKSAVAEGCAPGGGYIYLKGSVEARKDVAFWKSLSGAETEGAEIVFSSLPVILRTVVENAGVAADVVLEAVMKSKKENWGFDAKNKKYVNLEEAGILDSTKVLRVALENAISTASTILLIDNVIVPEPDEKKCDCGK
jgi:chaperonin GroEL